MSRYRQEFTKRPPRLTRLFDHVRPFYFITFNTRERAPMLNQERLHRTFVDFCRKAGKRNITVGRYVLMPDHIHLFVVFPEAEMTLTRWVSLLKLALGKELLQLGFARPHWQEGFFDHVLRNAESYGEKWEYVRMNPVRAGLCERPEDWGYQGEISRLEY